MNKKCPSCESSFEPEPGFYFGAMYISYAFNVALLVGFGIILFLFFEDWSELTYILVLTSLTIVIAPFTFRFSRILWLYWWGGLKFKNWDFNY